MKKIIALVALCCATPFFSACGDDARNAPSEDFEGLTARSYSEFVRDPAMFRLRDVRSYETLLYAPFRDRLAEDLRRNYPDFDPDGNADHRRFLCLLSSPPACRELASGLPPSMRDIEEAFNRQSLADEIEASDALYACLRAKPGLLWVKLAALEFCLSAEKNSGKNFMLQRNHEAKRRFIPVFLRAHPNDPLAAYAVFSWFYDAKAEYFSESDTDDPWIRLMLEGIRFRRKAWEARGDGFAYTVTEAGWIAFSENLELAIDRFEKAGALRPEFPNPFVLSANAALSCSALGADPIPFAKKAMLAAVDNGLVGATTANYLLPRWGGSHREIREFVMNCVRNAPAGTNVPAQAIDAFDTLKCDLRFPARLAFFTPELWEAFAAFRRREKEDGREFAPNFSARLALACGAYDDAARIFEANRQTCENYAASLRGDADPDRNVLAFIDLPSFVPAFTTGTRASEMRALLDALRSRKTATPETKNALEAIIRDETADANTRQVAFDLYLRLFVARSDDFAAFPERALARHLWNYYYMIKKDDFPEEELKELLSLAACVPGQAAASHRGRDLFVYSVPEMLVRGFFSQNLSEGKKELFAEMLCRNDPAEARKLMNRARSTYDFRLMRMLAEHGASAEDVRQERNASYFVQCPKKERPALLKALLKCGFDPNFPEFEGSLLAVCCMQGDFESAETLLAGGADPQWRPEGSKSLADVLRDKGARDAALREFCEKHGITATR